MAYNATSQQAQDNTQTPSPGASPSVSLSGGGAGFAGQGAAPTAGGSPGAPGSYAAHPTSSGSWTNLNSYLDANSSQAGAMGQSIAQSVGGQAQQAQSNLGAVQQGYQNQSPYQNINALSSSGVDQTLNASNYAAGQSTTQANNIMNDSWGVTPSNSDITQYAPASGPSWGSVQGEYATANQNLQDTQSESGRDLLLQNQYAQNGAGYNPGEQNFDQLLLEQTPANQASLNSTYNQYSPGIVSPQANSTQGQTEATANQAGLSPDLYNAEQSAKAYNTKEQGLATGYQTQAQSDLGNQVSSLGTNLGNEVTQGKNNWNNSYNQAQSDLASKQLSPIEAANMGLGSLSTPTRLYNVNPGSYLSENANPYAQSQGADLAATSGDWSNYQGLQALLSGDTGSNQAQLSSKLNATGLTGTEQQAQQAQASLQNPYSFDTQNFKNALGAAQSQYNTAATQNAPGMWQSGLGTYGTLTYAGLQSALNGTNTMYGAPAGSTEAQQMQSALNQFNTGQGWNNLLGLIGGVPSSGSGALAPR